MLHVFFPEKLSYGTELIIKADYQTSCLYHHIIFWLCTLLKKKLLEYPVKSLCIFYNQVEIYLI